jgi:hypothetical protein
VAAGAGLGGPSSLRKLKALLPDELLDELLAGARRQPMRSPHRNPTPQNSGAVRPCEVDRPHSI